MIKARDMVNLAGELNEKLTFATSTISTTSTPSRTPTPTSSSQSSNTTQSSLTLINNNESRSPNNSSSSSYELPEEATFIRSSLSQLGLQMTNVPVTNDMIKDEDKWINELARELGEVLRGMMRDRGIIALDEVWGGWNRARGVGTSTSLSPSLFSPPLCYLLFDYNPLT
jgi:ESCRT-II complex subunit VPS36